MFRTSLNRAIRDTPACEAGKYFGKVPEGAINFSIGEPAFDPPESVISAYEEAVRSGANRYAPIQGYPELRESLAEKFRRENGIPADPDNVIVTNGATEAIAFTIMSLVEKGDEVVVFEPNYPIVSPMVTYCGGKPVVIPLREDNGFRIDTEELKERVSKRTKLMVINTPHNPTGTVFGREDIRAVSEIHRGAIISDEVYEKITYEEGHHSPASFAENPERFITVNSFSKSYCMCGYRVGYLHAHPELIRQIMKLKLYVTNCCPAPSQKAALAAMGDRDFPRRIREEFRKRRDILLKGFERIGMPCSRPRGAFYAFPNVSAMGNDEEVHGKFLDAGVLTMPGRIFGSSHSDHVRFSYVCSPEDIGEGIRRLEEMEQ